MYRTALGNASATLPFALTFDAAQLDPRGTCAVAAGIEAGGRLLWVTDACHTIAPGAPPATLELVVVQAR